MADREILQIYSLNLLRSLAGDTRRGPPRKVYSPASLCRLLIHRDRSLAL